MHQKMTISSFPLPCAYPSLFKVLLLPSSSVGVGVDAVALRGGPNVRMTGGSFSVWQMLAQNVTCLDNQSIYIPPPQTIITLRILECYSVVFKEEWGEIGY